MNDVTSVGNRLQHLETAPEFDTFTRVIVHAGQTTDAQGNTKDLDYIAGNTTGRTLEVTDPNGTQAKANAMLAKLRSSAFQYQPGQLQTAQLDPSAEIGDGISAGNDFYSGIYKKDTTFSSLMTANVEAPSDEEIEHEYPYIPKADREFKRESQYTRSQLKINANAITSEVSARQTAITGLNTELTSKINQTASSINATVTRVDNNKLNHTRTNSTFGWKLTADGFYLNASNNKNVFTCTKDGIIIQGNASVTGKITATSGYIGNGSNGFAINSTSISHGTLNANKDDLAVDSNGNFVNGVYLSNWKFRMGNNFYVTHSGYVEAKNLNLKGGSIVINDSNGNAAFKVTSAGAVSATNLTITGGSIRLGNDFRVDSSGNLTANRGTFGSLSVSSGSSSYSGRLSGCSGSVSSGLSYGGGSYGSLGGLDTGLKNVSVRVDSLEANSITTNNLVAKIANAGTVSISTLVLNGNYVTLHTEAWYDLEERFHRIYYWGI